MTPVAAYRPPEWADLYVMLGGAAAVLTGLLFTALSLGPRQILAKPDHRGRARETLFQLIAVLMSAMAVLIPGQGNGALAIELAAVAGAMVFASARFQWQTVRAMPPRQRLGWSVRVLAPNAATLSIAMAGVSLYVGRAGGLYWLAASNAVYLVWSCSNAWQLMRSVPEQ